jgi:hypothetical protein
MVAEQVRIDGLVEVEVPPAFRSLRDSCGLVMAANFVGSREKSNLGFLK